MTAIKKALDKAKSKTVRSEVDKDERRRKLAQSLYKDIKFPHTNQKPY